MGLILLRTAQYGGPYFFALLLVLTLASLVVGAVVLTSIWSGDKDRRGDARKTLKILLRRKSDE